MGRWAAQVEKALSRLIKATSNEQTEKVKISTGNGLELVEYTETSNRYVAHNGVEIMLDYGSEPGHVTSIETNYYSVVHLNAGQQGLVRDYLSAYNYKLEKIHLVADNADYAVLAWAAYGDTEALDLAGTAWLEVSSSN